MLKTHIPYYHFLNTLILVFILMLPNTPSAAITQSASGAYEDVVIYQKTANGELQLLSSNQGSVTTFGSFGFSSDGPLM